MPLHPLLHGMILPVHARHPCLELSSQLHYQDVCCREAGGKSSKQHGQACSVSPYSKLGLLSLLSGLR